MYYLLGILVIFGGFKNLCSEDLDDEDGVTSPYNSVLLPPEQFEPETATVSSLSQETLEAVHLLAKNISHSKSAYRETNAKAVGEKEVRRSILRKATVASDSLAIKELLEVFGKLDVEGKLEVLAFMENLVHQYDVAVNFATVGGLKIIAPFLFSSNDAIVSSVASVLGSAMQSNPHVKKLAKDEAIGKNLLELLSHSSVSVVPRILFALSSFLRNDHEAQEEFIELSGVSILADILKNQNIATRTRLKIINLFNDLAVEQHDAYEYNEKERRAALQRSFENEVIRCNICELIVSFLSADDYDTLEKTIAAMKSLVNVCHNDLKSVKDRMEALLIIYDPASDGKDPLYPELDVDLKKVLHSELSDLIRIIEENTNTSNQDSFKDEL